MKRHCHDERKTPGHGRERTSSYAIDLAVSGQLSRAEARAMLISLRLEVFPTKGYDTNLPRCFRSRRLKNQAGRLQVGRSMPPPGRLEGKQALPMFKTQS